MRVNHLPAAGSSLLLRQNSRDVHRNLITSVLRYRLCCGGLTVHLGKVRVHDELGFVVLYAYVLSIVC